MDTWDVDAWDIVLIGPLDAVVHVRDRLHECGDLVEADPVVADHDDPTHGSCCLRVVARPPGTWPRRDMPTVRDQHP